MKAPGSTALEMGGPSLQSEILRLCDAVAESAIQTARSRDTDPAPPPDAGAVNDEMAPRSRDSGGEAFYDTIPAPPPSSAKEADVIDPLVSPPTMPSPRVPNIA